MPGVSLQRVGAVYLRAVVVAVNQREVLAETFAHWTGALVLASGDSPSTANVIPWTANVAPLASIVRSAEANILRRQGNSCSAIGGNAQTVRCGRSCSKGPAAACYVRNDHDLFATVQLRSDRTSIGP